MRPFDWWALFDIARYVGTVLTGAVVVWTLVMAAPCRVGPHPAMDAGWGAGRVCEARP